MPAEVAEAVEPHRLIDHRPHEFILHPRAESPRPLVSFDRVMGWRLEPEAGEGSFERTDEEQLWGAHVGRVELPAAASLLRPPEPIPLRDRFDSVSLWVKPRETRPRGDRAARTLSVLVRDAEGVETALTLGAIDWEGWRLVHLRVPAETIETLRHPCLFAGLQWSAGEEADVHFIDSLAFYTEPLRPLEFPVRGHVPVDWPPGHAPGLYAGEAPLPFPVEANTVVPPAGDAVRRRQLDEEAPDLYRFSFFTDAGHFAYRVDVRAGAPSIDVEFEGADLGALFEGGGIRGPRALHEAVAVSRREGERVRVEYTSGAWYEFQLVGGSLVMDAFLRGGAATHFDAGRTVSAHALHRLVLPGVPADLADFVWLVPAPAGDRPEPIFVGRVFDAIRSGASRIEPVAEGMGQPRYLPLVNGRRGDLYERLVFTVAPRIEDVLPGVAHPPSAHGEVMAARMWVDVSADEALLDMPRVAAQAAEMGLADVAMGVGEVAWRDVSENATFRTRASERFGGDNGLADWVAAIQAQGWRVGLDAGYREISALNQHGSPDHLLRDSHGGWRRAPSGRYQVKPPAALRLQEEIAERLAERYAPGLAFLGGLTDALPWDATDYDDRVPGAGRFSQAWLSYGELLLQEQALLNAPSVGRGGSWFYAGLADGLLSGEEESTLQTPPYLPFFDLARLQPLCVRFGLGVLPADTPAPERSERLDRYLAGQIAYGRNGRLPPQGWRTDLQARAYYAMQALQMRYAGRTAERIAYWDGERYVSGAHAIQSGIVERSQLYVLFDNGFEVWVNGSAKESWSVRVGRTVWALPPFGWVASGEGMLALSATLGEGRVDFVRSPEYLYWDGRGDETPYAEIASRGPLAIRVVDEDDAWGLDVRAPGGTRRFGLGDVVRQGASLREVSLFGADGEALGPAAVVVDDEGMNWVESHLPIHRAFFPLRTEETPVMGGLDREGIMPRP